MTEPADIAVIGMAARFPGAENIFQFWENIKNGVESIRQYSKEELQHSVSDEDLNDSNYVKARGSIDNADYFAASFFGYTPQDAKLMDPQQRILLEVAYHALENAGIVPEHYNGNIGTFVSTSFSTYLLMCLAARPELSNSSNHYPLVIANGNDFLATRIAYKLNLTGPAQTIQTACSSSLAAIHYACQSLINYESDTAIAGGVSINCPLDVGYLYKKNGIGSPDGHCRPFDSESEGTVPGDGAGIVVLKRLEDAIAENDHIYAVIKGSAVNNDGNKKVSYTAPSVQGQEYAIRTAHALSKIAAESISYIEAHGTGTSVGDPIEIEALTRAFGADSEFKNHCAIGSVKANIGHLDVASGVAGFIKTVLMLHNKQLPPQINFNKPNPRIPFSNSPFYVNNELKSWKTGNMPRRAGVSSFGIGGTNVHIVLEGYEAPANSDNDEVFLLPISAETPEILENLKSSIIEFINNHNSVSLSNVAYSLKKRQAFAKRDYLLVSRVGSRVKTHQSSDSKKVDIVKFEHLNDWLTGKDVDWNPTYGKITPLPNYPFARDKYWIESNVIKLSSEHTSQAVDLDKPSINYSLEDGVIDILKELCDLNHVLPTDSFLGLGVDSLMMVDISIQINERFGLETNNQDFYSCADIRDFCELTLQSNKLLEDTKLPSLALMIKRGHSKKTLFCIHPAGGAIGVFQEMANYINEDYRIIAIRCKGWDGSELPDDDIINMANEYYEIIKSIQDSGPYYICGSSVGGTIAFEIVRRLSDEKERIGLLALIDAPTSLKQNYLSIPSTVREIRDYVETLYPDMADTLNQLEQRDKNKSEVFYSIWRAHASSLFSYKPSTYNGKIVYFSATEENSYLPKNLAFDWLSVVKGGMEIHSIPGNHISMHFGQGATLIADVLNEKFAIIN